jgi:hypothetical protein
MLNHAAQSYFFKVNQFLNPSKIIKMETKKEVTENPLFTIARKKHNEQFLTWEYDFLHLTPENENCYILGFCGGVSHAASIWQIQIETLQKKVEELEKMQSPTLALQIPKEKIEIKLDEENSSTLHY